MRVAIYSRISTTNRGQDVLNQVEVLQEFSSKMSYQIIDVYKDEISGAKPDRPQFKSMMEDASMRKFDLVLFWSLDRFTREGTRATIKYLEQLESYGVTFKSYTEQYIDGSGIFRDVIISLLSTLAKQESVRISERVKAGLARSKKKGGRPTLDAKSISKIKSLKMKGLSNRKIGIELGVSHSTVGTYV